MKKHQSRGFFAGVGALLTAAALALVGGTAAHATTTPGNVPETSDVVITKLAQPETLGDAATGVPLDDLPSAPVEGVEFEAYLVEGTQQGGDNDIGTNAGQEWVRDQDSTSEVELAAEPAYSGTTDSGGVLQWTDVDRGLYVVTESGAPAGVTPSADFFLSVPLTDPATLNSWLDTIYVYPKNSVIESSKTVVDGVVDADGNVVDRSFVVGDDVTWTISTDIPRVPDATDSDADFAAPNGFRITDTINDDELLLAEDEDPVVTAGETLLESGVHYNHEPAAGEGQTTHQIEFTEEGLTALAAEVNANSAAQVTVQLITTVMSSGQIFNDANVYPNQQAIDNDDPQEVVPAEIRYGEHLVTKQDTDGSPLAGAQFRVYLTQDDAAATGDNYLTPATNTDGIWETDENGQLTIDGLRYSDWADNGLRAEGDDLYQTYWLAEVQAPEGHQLLPEPVSFDLTEDDESDQTIVNVPTQGAFVLPLTGGAGTAFLTIAGIAILAIVLLVLRRRRAMAATAE